MDIGVARRFAKDHPSWRPEDNNVFTADVPVRNIFSLPNTGPGCLTESEVVILGGCSHIGQQFMGKPDFYVETTPYIPYVHPTP